jgi:hypothetical protein
MPEGRLENQHGLALLGSLLLVSTLAVMSTAFLLIMAADVRIAQSHHRNTQAYYHAESAASAAAYKLSTQSSLQAIAEAMPQTFDFLIQPAPDTTYTQILTWGSGTDSFHVNVAYPIGYPSNRRLIWVQGLSTKALIDIYMDILLPTQDPRTYYSIVAGSMLDLSDWCGAEGGDGIWASGSIHDIDNDFQFESPSVANPFLMVGGSVEWSVNGIHPDWIGTALEVQTNAPIYSDIVPQILLSDTPPYDYMVTGDATVYRARSMASKDINGGTFNPSGSFGTEGANPMGIWVWDYSTGGTFRSNITINGTLYCPDDSPTSVLRFDDGDVTINPRTHSAPDPDERYPAIVSKGSIRVTGWGTRDFNGLVYCADRFESGPSSQWCYIDGMLIADEVVLIRRTTIRYDNRMRTQPAAPFAAGIYPTTVLHQRRYMYSLF